MKIFLKFNISKQDSAQNKYFLPPTSIKLKRDTWNTDLIEEDAKLTAITRYIDIVKYRVFFL